MDIPERIEVDGGASLVLTWADGSRTALAAAEVRAACPCAGCTSQDAVSPPPGTVEILDASVVGAYGLNLTFAPDHHHTGIYPFDRLRALGASG